MLTIVSHLDQRIAEKRARVGGPRITYRSIELAIGVPQTTSSDLASNRLTEFPEDALVALCAYLECPLCGPDGLIELVDQSEVLLAESRTAARRRREERLHRNEERRSRQG